MKRRILVFLVMLILMACATAAEVSIFPTSATVTQAQDPGNPDIRVWVDTLYGYYHCPNTRWYGATRQGVYMTQKQAQDRGYKPAVAVCK
jgi:hypothetical protein